MRAEFAFGTRWTGPGDLQDWHSQPAVFAIAWKNANLDVEATAVDHCVCDVTREIGTTSLGKVAYGYSASLTA